MDKKQEDLKKEEKKASKLLDLKIDKITSKKLKKDNVKKIPLHNKYIIPNHPARVGFFGPSGSGKTNLLAMLMIKKLFYFKYFEQVFVFSPNFYIDEAYRIIEAKYGKSKKDATDIQAFEYLDEEVLQSIIDQQKAICEEDGVDLANRVLIVLDDCITEKACNNNNRLFLQLFVMSRHWGISVWITSQSYKKLPITCRKNLSNLFMFEPSANEAKSISEEHETNVWPRKALQEMIMAITRTKYSFAHCNKQVHKNEQQWRMGLDYLIEPKEEKET